MSAPQDKTEPPHHADADHPRWVGVESPGARIGSFKLLSRLGEGGFGEVWLAERREPMVQRVALKIIKPGMDSREVIARFEQERQALAVMDHPNVARVLDAGTTPAEMGSRPYFVMEYVRGEPITTFCDRHRLSIRQRLELFIPVCEAIQHAHHKGIIHRDIKPSNVMVTMVETAGFANPDHADHPSTDTRGSLSGVVHGALVKVIDFGVAKAMTVSLTDKTIFTESGRMIGTPEYMSPEQAGGEADVDSRTDVYSLGVLLYELLTGALPLDPMQLRRSGLAELLRIVRETEPLRAGAVLQQDAQSAREVSRRRQVSSHELIRQLKSDLEWIPERAMKKDRRDRYRSAADIADDIRRYVRDEPLVARPPSIGYRLRKFGQRRRRWLVVVATNLLVAVGIVGVGLRFYLQQLAAEAQVSRLVSDRDAQLRSIGELITSLADAEESFGVGDSHAARTSLMTSALRHVEQFRSRFGDEPSVIRHEAWIHDALSRLAMDAARASQAPWGPSLEHARSATRLRRKLVEIHRADAVSEWDFVQSVYLYLSVLQSSINAAADARQIHRSHVEEASALIAELLSDSARVKRLGSPDAVQAELFDLRDRLHGN